MCHWHRYIDTALAQVLFMWYWHLNGHKLVCVEDNDFICHISHSFVRQNILALYGLNLNSIMVDFYLSLFWDMVSKIKYGLNIGVSGIN